MHVERTSEPTVLRWVCHDLRLGEPGPRTPGATDLSPLAVLYHAVRVISIYTVDGDLLIKCASNERWPELAPIVQDALVAELADPPPWLMISANGDVGRVDDFQPTLQEVQEVVELSAGPLAVSHGGRIEVVRVTSSGIAVKMHGACHGCFGADATLTNLVQRAVRHQWPQLVDVEVEPETRNGALIQISRFRRTFPSADH